MENVRSLLESIFVDLDRLIESVNQKRTANDETTLPRAKVRLLGQMSLLADEKTTAVLALVQTVDLDAQLSMDHFLKTELMRILRDHGLVYDEDSHLIWIPPGARFDALFNLKNVLVECLDSESTLVSKAVKAPQKNKQLIRQAIASGKFHSLVDRILENGGRLEDFT